MVLVAFFAAMPAGATSHLALRVEGTPEQVSLTLRDDGRGLPDPGAGVEPLGDNQRVGHHGLRWLTERVEGLRGELRIEPSPPRGACLRVRIPLVVATS